jgi:hypothetical protein
MADAPDARPSPLLRLRKALGRIRRRFALDVYDVFTRAVPAEVAPEPPPGYMFAWGTPGDLERCDPHHTELDQRERSAGLERLACGHRLVLGLWQGEAVFSMWVNPRNLNVPGLIKRRLGPHQWFIYKAFTSPEHRGRKLYETGMRFVLAEMGRAGLRELVGYAHVKKTVSRRGLAALSFGRAGRVYQLLAPGLRWTHLSRELRANFPEAGMRQGTSPALTQQP